MVLTNSRCNGFPLLTPGLIVFPLLGINLIIFLVFLLLSTVTVPQLRESRFLEVHFSYVPSDSWGKGILTLIDKGKPDVSSLNNWRPVTLLKVFRKIFTKIIGNRLRTFYMDSGGFSEAQKGFLPGERCFKHAFRLLAAIEDARRWKKDLKITWLDLKGAFPSIEFEILEKTIKWAGCTQEMITLIMSIVLNNWIIIRNNGSISEEILMERGAVQGDPISTILWILMLEPLLHKIEQIPNLGYKLGRNSGGLETSGLAWVDDLAFLANSDSGMGTMLEEFNSFLKANKMYCGIEKCKSLFISKGEITKRDSWRVQTRGFKGNGNNDQ